MITESSWETELTKEGTSLLDAVGLWVEAKNFYKRQFASRSKRKNQWRNIVTIHDKGCRLTPHFIITKSPLETKAVDKEHPKPRGSSRNDNSQTEQFCSNYPNRPRYVIKGSQNTLLTTPWTTCIIQINRFRIDKLDHLSGHRYPRAERGRWRSTNRKNFNH